MGIFDTSEFLTKSHCGTGWTDSLILLSQVSSLLIVLGYIIIAVEKYLIYIRKDNQIPHTLAFRLLILFPLICGFSRIGNFLTFWWVPYRFFVIIDWACAIITLLLAFQFRYIIQYLINIVPLHKQAEINSNLRREIEEHIITRVELEASNVSLHNLVIYLQTMIESEVWINNRAQTLMELSTLLDDIQKGNPYDSKSK